ncbi:MAG: hypothetical protein ABH864_02900 [archaeon]
MAWQKPPYHFDIAATAGVEEGRKLARDLAAGLKQNFRGIRVRQGYDPTGMNGHLGDGFSISGRRWGIRRDLAYVAVWTGAGCDPNDPQTTVEIRESHPAVLQALEGIFPKNGDAYGIQDVYVVGAHVSGRKVDADPLMRDTTAGLNRRCVKPKNEWVA